MPNDKEPSNSDIIKEIDTMIFRLNGLRSLIAKRLEDERKENEKSKNKK